MAKAKIKPTLQPVSETAMAEEEERRDREERSAGSVEDGRFIRRKPDREQIGIKTNSAIKKEFYRLRMLSGKSYTDLFNEAITDLGKKYDALSKGGK